MDNKIQIVLQLMSIIAIHSIDCNILEPKNLLFAAEFNADEEYVFSSSQDYIRVSRVHEPTLTRTTFPLCLAVGCTRTALLCEKRGGEMISTFRTVNDTRQVYFRSQLVKENVLLSVNCREAHIACCFEGVPNNAIKTVRAQLLEESLTARSDEPTDYERTLKKPENTSPPPSTPPPPPTPKPTPKPLLEQLVSPPATLAPLPSTPAPPPPPPPPKPIKVYLFSNICLGFLGGAGFVDCNG